MTLLLWHLRRQQVDACYYKSAVLPDIHDGSDYDMISGHAKTRKRIMTCANVMHLCRQEETDRRLSYRTGRLRARRCVTALMTSSWLLAAIYRVAPKIGTIILYALTLPNINRFSKLFHYQNQEKICNNAITKDSTTPQVCSYTTLWNVKWLKSKNWKQDDFCNNTF